MPGWTKQLPTEPGSYWLFYSLALGAEQFEVVQVRWYHIDDTERELRVNGGTLLSAYERCEWYGPLTPPPHP